MLINTVILFIKDILPIFILLSFIYTTISSRILAIKSFTSLLLASLMSVYLIYINIENLSEMFGGDGIEIYYCAVNALTYFCLQLISPSAKSGRPLTKALEMMLFFTLTLYIATNLSEFFLYFSTLLINKQALISTLIGSLFGFGICVSFSALFALFLNSVIAKQLKLRLGLWSLFLAGLITQNIQLLQQIDMLSSGTILWDTSIVVADASEYGYLLNALLGYIASPTLAYMVTYLASLLLSIGIFFYTDKKNTSMRVETPSRDK